MALSGSLTTNSVTYSSTTLYLTLSWTATQNTDNNTSTISWRLVSTVSPSGNHRGLRKVVVNIDGSNAYTAVYPYDSMFQAYNGTQVASGTRTISHNDDGTKTFTIEVKVNVGYSQEDYFNATGSKSFTLDQIPRNELAFVKISSGWKKGKVYVKTSSGWKEGKKVYVKTSTGWKESSLKG